MGRKNRFGVVEGEGRPLPADWRDALKMLPEDWRDFYEERAALIEYDGGEARATAERRAFECVLALAGEAWLARLGRRDFGWGHCATALAKAAPL